MSLSRIEEALQLLEAAARQPAPPPPLAQLQASNRRLHEAVVTSLSRIDALIARHGAGPQP